MIMLAVGALIIALVSSTRAGRAEARDRLRPWNPLFAVMTGLIVFGLVWHG